MKQVLFIFLIFLFSFGISIAQKNQSQGKYTVNPSAPNSFQRLNQSVVDSGTIRILYALNATDIHKQETYDDLQCLEIGSLLSKYYSYFLWESDSLTTDWVKKNPNAGEYDIPSWKLRPKGKFQGWSEYIHSEYFKNFSTNELTEYARMPHSLEKLNSQYSEFLPAQNWKISDDTLTVAGYSCQKASYQFRGRNYTAWFTIDIPIDNGPWKFGGLPGLILKVYDEKEQYVFECVRIENHKRKYPIKMHKEFSQYKKTDRMKLWKSKKEVQENYFQVVAGATGTHIVYGGSNAPSGFTPYNPMELE